MSFADIMLVIIAALLLASLFYLEKIRDGVQTIEAIQKKKFFRD